ncbi:MAG TPA: DUF2892 domain-containing protein [Acidimicrobiales bacterium]|nr:DUF2892 domain-containing protein [Acidimicrobiales bacterium]
MRLIQFLEGATGRLARVVAGAVLVGLGAWLGTTDGGGWWALLAVGLVPLAAGLANVCLLAPLFGAPVRHAPRSV